MEKVIYITYFVFEEESSPVLQADNTID